LARCAISAVKGFGPAVYYLAHDPEALIYQTFDSLDRMLGRKA